MDRLAPELLSMILSHVPFGERAHLRLVNKFWRDVIDGLKVNRLVLIDRDWSVFNKLWFHTNARNTLNDPGLLVSDLTKLPEKLVNSTLCNLRLLFIDLSNTPCANNFLNQFKQLEELNVFGHASTPSNWTLDLPRLRILSIRCDWDKRSDNMRIKLQTPCLIAFRCLSLSAYQFAFPERLTHLAELSVELSSIVKFVNLQCFYCSTIEFYEPVLDRLPKLQEVHSVDSVDTLYELDEERIRLGRADLKLYGRGIELADYTANEINLDLDEFEAAYYMLIKTGDLPFYSPQFKFGPMADLWIRNYGGFPARFFDKFENIRCIQVAYQVDELSFVQFIGNCRNLNSICFSHPNSEDLKRQLARLQPTITCLELADIPSVDCLLKFKYLMTLKLKKEPDSNEKIRFVGQFFSLFAQLRYLQRVLIMLDGKMFRISPVPGNRFRVGYGGLESKTFDSLDEVLSFLEQNVQKDKKVTKTRSSSVDKCCLS